MPRALLAWEGGDGRGHIVRLKTVAQALGDRFTFDAALCRLRHKAEIEHLCDAVAQGPWLPYSGKFRNAQGNPHTATWGEFMGDVGFCKPHVLRTSIGWWQQVMRDRNISLVIAESAPCALMAARGLGIKSIALGSGYLLPPPEMETFPVLIPRYSRRIYDEAEIVEIVNSVAHEFGCPPLRHLPEVYASTHPLVFTLDMLDAYAEWRSHPLLPPTTGEAPEPARGGDEVFIYFSTTEKSETGLMEAIGSFDVPVRLFMPSIDDDVAQALARRGLQVERSAVPASLIAKRTRVLVNSAQHGTLCLGLASGLPQVCVPQQLEHQYHGEAAAREGAVKIVDKADRTAESFRSIVMDVYEDTVMAERARSLSETLKPTFQRDMRTLIRQRVFAAID